MSPLLLPPFHFRRFSPLLHGQSPPEQRSSSSTLFPAPAAPFPHHLTHSHHPSSCSSARSHALQPLHPPHLLPYLPLPRRLLSLQARQQSVPSPSSCSPLTPSHRPPRPSPLRPHRQTSGQRHWRQSRRLHFRPRRRRDSDRERRRRRQRRTRHRASEGRRDWCQGVGIQ